MSENRVAIWKKKEVDKKRDEWINPNNGYSIEALKDYNYEIKL